MSMAMSSSASVFLLPSAFLPLYLSYSLSSSLEALFAMLTFSLLFTSCSPVSFLNPFSLGHSR